MKAGTNVMWLVEQVASGNKQESNRNIVYFEIQDSLHFVLADLKCFNISFWNIFCTAKHIWDPRAFHQKPGQNLTPLVIPKHKQRKFSISILHKKMKFSIEDIFSKCDLIRKELLIYSHLLKKSFMENFIFVQCIL